MDRPARALMPDYLRLVALFGIVVVNVQFIAYSLLSNPAQPVQGTQADAVALWLVNGLATFKSYSLFSFMFGVGLGFLMRSAARRGLGFGRLYRNRMIGLLVLGVAHGCLFFPGDILVLYALAGAILYRLRDWPAHRLVRLGAALIVLQGVIAAPLLLSMPAVPGDFAALERRVMTGGGFADAAAYRAVVFAFGLPSLVALQGIAALGWFCLGLAAVRAGLIDDAGHPLWRRARLWCLGPGMAASLVGAALWQWGDVAAGVILTVAAAPVASLGYLGAVAGLARPPGPVMARVLAVGGSSLSVYLGQSIVLSTVFSAYGLGLWDAVGRPAAVGIAVVVTAILIAALALWHSRHALGPFEWLLRRITYAGQGR